MGKMSNLFFCVFYFFKFSSTYFGGPITPSKNSKIKNPAVLVKLNLVKLYFDISHKYIDISVTEIVVHPSAAIAF